MDLTVGIILVEKICLAKGVSIHWTGLLDWLFSTQLYTHYPVFLLSVQTLAYVLWMTTSRNLLVVLWGANGILHHSYHSSVHDQYCETSLSLWDHSKSTCVIKWPLRLVHGVWLHILSIHFQRATGRLIITSLLVAEKYSIYLTIKWLSNPWASLILLYIFYPAVIGIQGTQQKE